MKALVVEVDGIVILKVVGGKFSFVEGSCVVGWASRRGHGAWVPICRHVRSWDVAGEKGVCSDVAVERVSVFDVVVFERTAKLGVGGGVGWLGRAPHAALEKLVLNVMTLVVDTVGILAE